MFKAIWPKYSTKKLLIEPTFCPKGQRSHRKVLRGGWSPDWCPFDIRIQIKGSRLEFTPPTMVMKMRHETRTSSNYAHISTKREMILSRHYVCWFEVLFLDLDGENPTLSPNTIFPPSTMSNTPWPMLGSQNLLMVSILQLEGVISHSEVICGGLRTHWWLSSFRR